MTETIAMTELELAMRKLAHQVKLDTILACAKIAASYPSGFGSEHEASGLIRRGQDDAARTIAERLRDMAASPSLLLQQRQSEG